MVCYKKIFLIMLLLIFSFSFSVFAIDNDSNLENVDFDVIESLGISVNTNYFVDNNNSYNLAYFKLEKGYIYYFDNISPGYSRGYAVSNQLPALNVTYDFLAYTNEDYSYICDDDNTYMYISFSPSTFVNVTRTRIHGIDNSIDDLVNNVGPNALWGVFGSGIDFVFVIVIVAFGIFIIYKLISGFSKGKSKI